MMRFLFRIALITVVLSVGQMVMRVTAASSSQEQSSPRTFSHWVHLQRKELYPMGSFLGTRDEKRAGET